MEMTEDSIKMALAYPFKARNKAKLLIKDFIFILSLEGLVCPPSIALRLLKWGSEKGLVEVKDGYVYALFDFGTYEIPFNFKLDSKIIEDTKLPYASWNEFLNINTSSIIKSNKKKKNIKREQNNKEEEEYIKDNKADSLMDYF